MTMDMYDVELEPAEPHGLAATIPAFPGLLVFGRDVDEVLERVRAAIAFHIGQPHNRGTHRIAITLRDAA